MDNDYKRGLKAGIEDKALGKCKRHEYGVNLFSDGYCKGYSTTPKLEEFDLKKNK